MAKSAKNTVSVVPVQGGKSALGGLVQAIAGLTPQEKALLQTTVAKGATDEELAWFLYLCKQYQVDPFLKQAFFIKYGGNQPTMMISRDGFLAIAHRHPEFQGLKSAVVYEGDEFEIDTVNQTVTHKQRGKRGDILGAWAAAYRKDRDPVVWFAPIDEYEQNKDVWKKYRSAMILKVAETFVLRRQFEIYGFSGEEELGGVDLSQPADMVVQPDETQVTVQSAPADDREERLLKMKELTAIAEAHGISRRELREIREQFTSEALPPLEVIDQIAGEVFRRIEQRMKQAEDQEPEVLDSRGPEGGVIDFDEGELF